MKLGRYYIDLNHCLGEDFSEYEFDDQGVPLTRFNRKPNWKYNPITVSQYGLHHFNHYLKSHSENSKKIFLKQAEWLVENIEDGPNGSKVWYYQIAMPFYEISAPWISGMAQGQALSVLLRAHQLTGEEIYLNVVNQAFLVFNVSAKKGGVVSCFPDGNPVIEEYVSAKFMIAVLNGFIFAIFGIYDFKIYTDDFGANQLFNKLVDSLKQNLYRYDCGYWSYYDLKFPLRLSSKPYHRIHLDQLDELYNITGEEQFRNYRDQWQDYLSSPICNLKWALRKLHQKLFIRI